MPKSQEKPQQPSPEEIKQVEEISGEKKSPLEIEEYFYKKYNCNLRTGWNTIALYDYNGKFRGTQEEKMMYDAYKRPPSEPEPDTRTRERRRY